MRKSISVAFFSTVATLMILGVAVMGLSQLVLFSRYFAQERFGALDDVGGLVSRTAGYFLKDLADGQPMTDAGVSDKVDLIGESANVHIFFTDDHGSVVLASNNDYLAVRAGAGRGDGGCGQRIGRGISPAGQAGGRPDRAVLCVRAAHRVQRRAGGLCVRLRVGPDAG